MTSSKSKSTLPARAAEGKKFAIAVSRYHSELTEKLLDGAVETLVSLGAKKDNVSSVWVPGSFELPLAARALVHQSFDAVICLGVIVKGETAHDEFIAREAARGLAQVSQASGVPVIFGVLTTQDLDQAQARCGGKRGHKGVESAEAAVSMLLTLEEIKKLGAKPTKSVGFY